MIQLRVADGPSLFVAASCQVADICCEMTTTMYVPRVPSHVQNGCTCGPAGPSWPDMRIGSGCFLPDHRRGIGSTG